MTELRFVFKRTNEFGRWHDGQSPLNRIRIDARLDAIAEGRFGDSRSLGSGLFELKWKNGMRVYFSRRRVAGIDLFVLWGGFKGSQGADILKSRRLKSRSEHEAQIQETESKDEP
ncbi:MAG TPA: type II toxin-antitoxin system RelE/ParE family toxin [Elusimicrobiota bacterium]|jgi:putative addiction module killer protein|nr:type II toxin-antitoxin system RelE/ParE family toxin [Elusimicrobiota bacterium]